MASIEYEVGAAALAPKNLGLDLDKSVARFAEELERALARELAGHLITVTKSDAPRHRVQIADAADPDALALKVEAVARAVRDCVDWTVYG